MYQPPVPVAKILAGIHNGKYALPAIQREFVWDTDQICRLFDSLMLGYPIGAFLFWEVESQFASKYTFYEFLTHYHEKSNPFAPQKNIPAGQGMTAILDGQQRLTALNIGLYGSFAERLSRKWWNNPDAFPQRKLYLNLLGEPNLDEEQGLTYEFKFLTKEAAAAADGDPNKWFLVADILSFQNSGPEMLKYLHDRGLMDAHSYEILYQLYQSIRETPSINAYIETSQDPEKVLNIFVRVNSGGTQLSYSDLLRSMATNQWSELDAREEIRSLVTDLREVSGGFDFSKDLILKTGLVLIDANDFGFKVANFTSANMAAVESMWPRIRSALITSARLLASFGYNAQTLTADSVIIPIAYYLHRRNYGQNFIDSVSFTEDRQGIHHWVTRSLLKRGIWGSGLDTLLKELRTVIQEHGAHRFPVEKIQTAMEARGKSLSFGDAEIEELLDLKYGKARTFSLLSILYPGLDFSKEFHEDHIFPRSKVRRAELRKLGVADDQIEEFMDEADSIPNLQLLGGVANIEKQAMMPSEWLTSPYFKSAAARQNYVTDNDLEFLPESITEFLQFLEKRRINMRNRLETALGS